MLIAFDINTNFVALLSLIVIVSYIELVSLNKSIIRNT